MQDISTIIESGAANPWLYLPAAILLGALHALEPGHSKSLMAAFIVAIRGTATQAALLGVSAAVGHTIVVWALALTGLYLGDRLILEKAEPWLILITGLLIITLAARLVFSAKSIIERHQTNAHVGHDHAGHHHEAGDDEDVHAALHRREIEANYAGRRNVSNGEIIWFGFTGGFLPCPSAIAVLLVCLQLKKFTLGVAMVAAFSIGLAATLVAVGIAAAWGTAKAASRFSSFGIWADRVPLLSGALVMALGLFITLRGMIALGWL